MGKTMDKATVLYGANHNVNLTNIKWDELQQAILAEVGDEPLATPIAGAKKVIEEAKKGKGLQKPYVKVGLVDGNLVLRIKDPRTFIDKEIDTILVKQFKQKKEAHKQMVAAMGNAGGVGDKGVVVALDPSDKIIKDAAESIAKKRKLGEDAPLQRQGQTYDDQTKGHTGTPLEDEKLKQKAFSDSSNAPIVLLAHGSPLGKVGSGKVHASHFADKKPAEIISYLKKSLPVTYSGVVYLDGCYTAAGNTPLNFAKQVYDGLLKAGYFYLQVKGNLGMARTINGKECVTPAEIETAYEKAGEEKKKLEAEQKSLTAPYDKALGEAVEKENALRRETLIAKRPKPENWTDEEKARMAKIDSVIKAISEKLKTDPKLVKIAARL